MLFRCIIILMVTYRNGQTSWFLSFKNLCHNSWIRSILKFYCGLLQHHKIWVVQMISEHFVIIQVCLTISINCTFIHLTCISLDNAAHFESIIRLVSVVMGCPPLSTHLWTHLFDPVQIKGYSLPATLVSSNFFS